MMTMRISDTRVSATVVFCYLGALALGCGDGSKKATDAALDSGRDTGGSDDSLAPADTAQDSTKPNPWSDGAVDAISAEAPVDVASPDAVMDASQSDANQGDGLPGHEAGGDSRGDSEVPTTMANITFRFKNAGASTLYVHQACTILVRVTSLADGKTYGTNYACACDCASPTCNGGLACGACAPDSGVPIDVGSARDITWLAQFTTSQLKTGPNGSFQCENHSPIPTGPYKVEILVYDSSADATSQTNSRKVEKTFSLGTADATIEVPLQ
jgi:hypothetical protein